VSPGGEKRWVTAVQLPVAEGLWGQFHFTALTIVLKMLFTANHHDDSLTTGMRSARHRSVWTMPQGQSQTARKAQHIGNNIILKRLLLSEKESQWGDECPCQEQSAGPGRPMHLF
jgi:hypothetical protein